MHPLYLAFANALLWIAFDREVANSQKDLCNGDLEEGVLGQHFLSPYPSVGMARTHCDCFQSV
jgi:hypothetical protein